MLAALCLWMGKVAANTEKIIFIAPELLSLSQTGPSLSNLNLDVLSPASTVFRTALPVSFPTDQFPDGNSSWYILSDLNPSQRYELRVCWTATVCVASGPGWDMR